MWFVDDLSLREVVADREWVEERYTELEGDPGTWGERVVLLRVLGRLDEAARLGAAHLAAIGDASAGPRARALVRLAHVHQWRGEFARAEELLADALATAVRLPRDERSLVSALVLQHRATNRFESGDLTGARTDVEAALDLRLEVDAPADQVTSSRQALRAIAGRQQQGDDAGRRVVLSAVAALVPTSGRSVVGVDGVDDAGTTRFAAALLGHLRGVGREVSTDGAPDLRVFLQHGRTVDPDRPGATADVLVDDADAEAPVLLRLTASRLRGADLDDAQREG